MSDFPAQLDTNRVATLSLVEIALQHAQAAQADGERGYEAGARIHLAARQCLRLCLAVAADKSQRQARRRRAILELIEQHAQAGIVLAASLQDDKIVNGERRRALLDLLIVLADLAYYLDVLGRGGWAGEL